MLRVLILVLAVTACARFPELDGVAGADVDDAKFPKLINIEPILNLPEGQGAQRAEITETLLGRVAALQARADALRGDVVDAKTRRRMAKGVKTPDYAVDL